MFINNRKSLAIFLSGIGFGILIPSTIFLFHAESHKVASYLGIFGILLFLVGIFLRPTNGKRWT